MRYIALNIRLGVVGDKPIEKIRQKFQDGIIKKIFPEVENIERLGEQYTTSIPYRTILYKPQHVRDIIKKIASRYSDQSLDLILLDLSNNDCQEFREDVFLSLIDGVNDLADPEENPINPIKIFIFLLPLMPGSRKRNGSEISINSSEYLQIKNMKSEKNTIVLLTNDYKSFVYGANPIVIPDDIFEIYHKHMAALKENPIHLLCEKTIRKLGHFHSNKKINGERCCRPYTYFTYDAGKEIGELLSVWWSKYSNNSEYIIYDSNNNDSLHEAINAFAEIEKIPVYYIEDVMSDNSIHKEVTEEKIDKTFTLIVDAVDTSATVTNYIEDLVKLNVYPNENILSVFAPAASIIKEISRKKYVIHAFISKKHEPIPESKCPQCIIGLPYSSELSEDYFMLRAYDIYHMIDSVGIEPEPKEEVPETGYPYSYIPKYEEMIEEFGDWLAYKMEYYLIKSIGIPENLFIIHPEEVASKALSDKLRFRFNKKITTVKIPRYQITKAQKNNNDWSEILIEEAKEGWVEQIESLIDQGATALIIDYLNGSGKTFQSLQKMLTKLEIGVYCYFPFVDRDPGADSVEKYPFNKLCLYEWYGPRQLKRNLSNV